MKQILVRAIFSLLDDADENLFSLRRATHQPDAAATDGVACFAGGRSDAPLYRAVLVVAGLAETPRALASASPGAIAGYRALLGGLDHPLQVLVRPEPFEAAAEAAGWDRRATGLPPQLAALACEHAVWVRRDLPALGLLVRRAYLVVPAESVAADERPGLRLGARLRGKPTASLDAEQARAARWSKPPPSACGWCASSKQTHRIGRGRCGGSTFRKATDRAAYDH